HRRLACEPGGCSAPVAGYSACLTSFTSSIRFSLHAYEQRARAVISSPNFRQQQQQLAEAYAGVTHAWSLGLEKYPAVVFDDVFVVYGTTDVNEATRQLAAWKEKNR
ncbi:TIGR03757 family integrating conjugative element protein, partial [Cronobacter sakazakii]